MRNFSQQVSLSSTFVLDSSSSADTLQRVEVALAVTMGANPEFLNPSEERVLDDFFGWFECNKALERSHVSGSNPRALAVISPVFVYHNLNAGHSVAVIWSDVKGKVSYMPPNR